MVGQTISSKVAGWGTSETTSAIADAWKQSYHRE